MAREDLHFRLRIPEDLKARVEASAEASHRSMTSEIISRLEQSFEPPRTPTGAAIVAPMLPDGTVMAGVYLVDASVYESTIQQDGSILLTKRRQEAS